jgi:hypothetical protein
MRKQRNGPKGKPLAQKARQPLSSILGPLAHVGATKKAVGKNGRLLIPLERPFDRRRPTIRSGRTRPRLPEPRVGLRIRLPDRRLSADIATKSLREAQAAIRNAGADAVALILQGSHVEGDVIAEAA